MYNAEPIVGNWYHSPGTAQTFTVVDVDENQGDIELRYHDGSVDHIDFFIWGNLGAKPAEAPTTSPEGKSGNLRSQRGDKMRLNAVTEQEENNPRRRLG